MDVVFRGTNFIGNVTTVNAGNNIVVNSVKVDSATGLTANLTIAAEADTGAHNFAVVNPGPGGGTSSYRVFRVNNPAPTLSSISPNIGERGQKLDIVLTGTNFLNGVTKLNMDAGIFVNSMTITSPSSLKANLTIADTAITGAHNFSVTNPAPGGGTSVKRVFTVNNPIPTISSIMPTNGIIGQTLDVVITGAKFFSGVSSASFGADITVNSIKVNSSTKTAANLTISSSAAAGPRNVAVTNAASGGGTATLTNGFTVNNPVPTLTNIAPTSGNRLQTIEVVFTGTNFINGVTSVNTGPGITVNSTTVISSTGLKARLTIAATAVTGARSFTITNSAPGGGTATRTNVFTVNNPVPTLIKINPSNAKRGQTINVGFKGTNFLDKITSINVGTSIIVNRVTVHRADSLTVNLTIDKNASPESRNFSATNNAPGGGTSGNLVFTIINNEPTPPKLIAPANKDTIKLVTPTRPLKFVWRKSKDGDAQDTLKYTLNIKGPGLDTTVAGVKDTSLALNTMPRLKVASNYSWTVKVTDSFVTITSADIFSFRTSDKLTGIDEHFSEIPTAFLIEQNYL
ncbi:MAG: beta strand repeat-containing protein, partial [bacterium]